jgi:NTE family protein
MKDVRVHSIADDALMRQLGVASKVTPNKGLLLQLKAAGRAAMDRFLTDHRDRIGVEGTLDLQATIG